MSAPIKMNKKLASQIIGNLSVPSKMPGFAWSIPAKECKTGSKLRQVKGSTCSKCYALSGRYVFPNVQDAQYKRFDILLTILFEIEKYPLRFALMLKACKEQDVESFAKYSNKLPKTVEFLQAFTYLLQKNNQPEFRWHDSGDLQSRAHLYLIVAIALLNPNIQFWLPTREYKIVLDWLASSNNEIPDNLNIRLSAHMVDGPVPEWAYAKGLTTSGVTTDHSQGNCHAQIASPDKSCDTCRACWDKSVLHVDYIAH